MSASVKARMELDSSGFQQGLDKAGAKLNAFASGQLGSIKGMLAGAFTVGAIVKLTSDAVELGGKFDDLSKRTSVSAEELQRLDYVAKQNGSSIESLVGGLQKLAVARQKALADPGGEQGQAFQDLGISIEEIARLSPELLFYRIADAVKNQGAAVNNAASMTALLGRSFGELVPMMVGGGDGMRTLADEIERAGGIISNLEIKKLDELGDKMGRVKFMASAMAATTVAALYDMAKAIAHLPSFIDVLRGNATPGALALAKSWMGTGKESTPPAVGAGDSALSTASDSQLRSFQEARRRFMESGMTDEEKLADLQQRSAVKLEEAAAAYKKNKAEGVALETESLRLETEAAELQKRMDADKARQLEIKAADASELADARAGKGISVAAPISDNLARIGGYVGGSGGEGLRESQRQTKVAEKVLDVLKKIEARGSKDMNLNDATPL